MYELGLDLEYTKQQDTEYTRRLENLKKRYFFVTHIKHPIKEGSIENIYLKSLYTHLIQNTDDECFTNKIQVTDMNIHDKDNVYYCFKDADLSISKNKQEMSMCHSHSSSKINTNNYLKENTEIYSFIKETMNIRLNNSDTQNMNQIYTFEEMKSHLNLRTITFDEMPHSPVKIGEASFSEVFKIDGLIYKIIPFTEWYSLESFCREAFILDTLKDQQGVCKLVDKFLISGHYSDEYLKAWDDFVGSENLRPSNTEESQTYGVLVMNDCGKDLEKYEFQSRNEIICFFDQILSIVTILEDRFKFEHRDMHWGNIMINGSCVYLIDLNFARLEKEKIIYTDLNKEEWLFEGDENIDIQFSVYIQMKESCGSDWISFHPATNFLWIKYLLNKMKIKSETIRCNKERSLSKKIIRKMISSAEKISTCKDFKKWFDENILKSKSLKYV